MRSQALGDSLSRLSSIEASGFELPEATRILRIGRAMIVVELTAITLIR